MERSKNRIPAPIIDPSYFGVSFSIKQCRDFKIDQTDTLKFLITTMEFRRFRLMSYWNEHEAKEGVYDFTELDYQFETIEQNGGIVTLCLGVRQPRWPESHWPEWSLELSEPQRYAALYKYIKVVVNRYKSRGSIISWQLENEALNRNFGQNGDFNRKRLTHEYSLVRSLDSTRPIIMTTSNSWGIPLRRPSADTYGFTYYQIQHNSNGYRKSKIPWWWYRMRSFTIWLITQKPCFIHELQAEPWGPKAIWEMSKLEQDKSMNVAQLQANLRRAKKTKLYPIDLWGGEWWYTRHLQGDDEIYKIIKTDLDL